LFDFSSEANWNVTHLARVEAESIHIFREVVAEAENPVMLYSVGKNSSVILHLARKAFYPSPTPFPMLHLASGWDFSDLLAHRDKTVRDYGLELIVAVNEDTEAQGINLFDTGSALYSQVQLADPLKPALDAHELDTAFGGGRRDEEKSRAVGVAADRPRILVSGTRPAREAEAVAAALQGELVPMGSAGAKATAVVLVDAEVYLHSGGQFEWDGCAPVAVASAHSLHCSRIDGSPLVFNQADTYMPDLLICRPELAERVLAEVAKLG
jgi:hypothetical protein